MTSISLPINQKVYLGHFSRKIETDTNSLYDRIFRPILSFFGIRKYNLSKVIYHLEAHKTEDTKSQINALTGKLFSKLKLTQEYTTLCLLSSYYQAKEKGKTFYLTPEQKVQLEIFLAKAKNNQPLNQKLKKLKKLLPYSHLIHKKALETLITFSFKTSRRKLDSFNIAYKKMKNIQAHLTTKNSTKEVSDKLTLDEIELLESMAKLNKVFKDFQEMSLFSIKTDPLAIQMRSLSRKITQTNTFIKYMQDKIEKEITDAGNDVAIIFYPYNIHHRKNSIWRKLYDKIYGFVLGTKFFHTSIQYKNIDNQIQEGHIWGEEHPISKFIQSRRTLSSYLKNKTIGINFARIFKNQEIIEKLIALYGADWKKEIQKKTIDIFKQYFIENKARIEKLRNPVGKRLLAARWKAYLSLFSKSFDENIQFDSDNTVICSEFTAKVLMQGFAKLLEKIDEDNKAKNSSYIKIKLSLLSQPLPSKHLLINRFTPQNVADFIGKRIGTEAQTPDILRQVAIFKA